MIDEITSISKNGCTCDRWVENKKESFVSNILSNKHKACLDAHKVNRNDILQKQKGAIRQLRGFNCNK